jgi:hypothetical protein
MRSAAVIIRLGFMSLNLKVETETHSMEKGELVHGYKTMEAFVDLLCFKLILLQVNYPLPYELIMKWYWIII